MRKILAFVLILAALSVPAYAANPDKDIFIIYTNDVHCGIDDYIGYSGLAYYVKQIKAANPYVTLVDAGDAVQGATVGAISHGRYIIEIMNFLSYDIAVPGNHEFDYGWGQFMNFAKTLKSGYIDCNFRDISTGKLFFQPYKILHYGNVKVAYVGICTPETLVKSTPMTFMDEEGHYIYDFDGDDNGKKLCASIQKAADDARAAGADFVIAVGHLGEYEDVTTEWSAPFVVANTRGIDAFIDGHSHEITPALKIKNLDGREINITQSGTKLAYIGQVVIHTDGTITTGLIDKTAGKDPDTEKFINEIKARFQDTLKSHLAYTSFDLLAMDDKGEWLIRDGETSLCNLVTDGALFAATETKTGRADIALINAGGMRTNVKAGEVTYNDALSVQPFGNTFGLYEISGQTILDELEHGARLYPYRSGGFLHVAGMTYTVNGKIPSPVKVDEHKRFIGIEGERRVSDVLVNGKPIDPQKKYIVAGTDFVIRGGGDGHAFKGARLVERDFMVDTDVLAHYLKYLGVIPERYRESQNRIKFVK